MTGAGTGAHGEPGELGTLARGGTMALAGAVGNGLLGLLLVVTVTRGLGAAGAGVFFEAVALFTIVANAAELGADTALVRAVPRLRAGGQVAALRPTLRVALAPVLLAGALAAVLIAVLAPALAGALLHGPGARGTVAMLRLLAPFLPLAAAGEVALAATRGFGSVAPYVMVGQLARPALRLVLAFAVIAAGLGAAAVALAWAAPAAAAFAAALALLARQVRRAEPPPTAGAAAAPAAGALARELWAFAAPRGLAGIFEIAVVWLDVLLVGALRSTSEAGVYAAAGRLAMAGTLALQALRLATAPQVSGLLARGRRDLAESVHRAATTWIVASSWPLYLTLAVFAGPVMRLFGPEFAAGGQALAILALATLANLATGNVQSVLLMGGGSGWNLGNAVAALSCNVALNLLLVPRLGITGAALAWAASILLDNLASLLEVRLLLGLRTFGHPFVAVAAAGAACYGLVGVLVRATLGAGAVSIAVALAAGTAAYLPALWRLRRILQLAVLGDALRARLPGAGPVRRAIEGVLRG